MSTPLLALSHISKRYPAVLANDAIDLNVMPKQIHAILGENGAGKSTLMKIIYGAVQPDAGSIHFDGKDISKLAPHARAALGMAYVPQGREIFARLTVEENILMGMATKPSQQAKRIKNEIFDLFPVLRTMLSRRGGDLSGGQQQQLAIARALVAEPKLIIFDEPTEGIQPSIIKDIGRVIRLLRDRGDIAILLCEQYFDFARELADHFVVLSRGEVVAQGDQTQMDSEDVKRHLSV